MKTCTRCQQAKELTEFYKASQKRDGLQASCKTCMAVSYSSSRKKKQAHYVEITRLRQRKNVDLMREWKESRGCQCCAENFGPCLELHHLDPEGKEADPSVLVYNSFNAFLQEAEKCVVLCANCHRKVHAGKIKLGVAQPG